MRFILTSFFFFVEDHIQTALWDLLHHLSFLYQHSLCQVNSWTTKSPRLRHRNQRTYMVAEQIMYQLDFPPPQHNHLHLLSFPCCHGYRVKQHYCKAWAAELRLCSSTWLTDLSWMGCSDQWPKGGNCLSTIKQGDDMYLNMCVCVCVCVGQIQWKHVHVVWHAYQCICRYIYQCLPVYISVTLFLFVRLLLHICPTCVRSQVFSGLILRLCGGEVILQEGLQVLKSVPLVGLPPPALQHQFMERGGAARGTGHPVASLHLLQYFTIVHA